MEGVHLKAGVTVGPFARLRPGTVLEEKSQVGNFVEVKNSHIQKATKVNHLSYIGDTTIGEKTNIGAGTITCNYDGYSKFRTTIGSNVFVGSQSIFLSPVHVGENSVIGAGSIVDKDIPSKALAVSRAPLQIQQNGGQSYHKRKKSLKEQNQKDAKKT